MLKITSPYIFNKISTKFLIATIFASPCLFILALYYAFYNSPIDYQQGETVRIMYIHVPAAWMALGIYIFIGICSVLSLIWKLRLTFLMAVAAAPIGASFAAITLITGSLWGYPIWGTWWVWDARLTSMLVLLLLYLAYIGVTNAGDDLYRTEKPAGVIALLGVINVPIVKFSVDIWNSLHQPASIIKMNGPTIDNAMLTPLFLMFAAYITFFIAIWILKVKTIISKHSFGSKIL